MADSEQPPLVPGIEVSAIRARPVLPASLNTGTRFKSVVAISFADP